MAPHIDEDSHFVALIVSNNANVHVAIAFKQISDALDALGA